MTRLERWSARSRWCALAVLLGAALVLFAPGADAWAATVRSEVVCFEVNNPGDPLPATLFGRRYTSGKPTAKTPALVLVHGVASSADNWDFTPTWSVARKLAEAGYVAIAYDRLGFARSRYDRPEGGLLITTPNQRDILHQVVERVQAGTYDVSSGGDCSAPRTPSSVRSDRIVIAGHSAGGAIVQGYPGKYHDVAAMIQSNYSNEGSGDVVTQQLTEVVAPSLAAGNDYVPFFRTREECERFNIYPPGAVAAVVQVACDPSKFVLTPAGEWSGFVQLQQENDQLIKATGGTPVLLAYGDHDAAFPPDTAQADYDNWRTSCPACDLTRYTEPSTGHLFMAHRSLPDWVKKVTGWLRSRGIAPSR